MVGLQWWGCLIIIHRLGGPFGFVTQTGELTQSVGCEILVIIPCASSSTASCSLLIVPLDLPDP